MDKVETNVKKLRLNIFCGHINVRPPIIVYGIFRTNRLTANMSVEALF